MSYLPLLLILTSAIWFAASIASGFSLARLCPGGEVFRPAWAFVLGNALLVVMLWNLSWLGFSVSEAAVPLLLGLPLINGAVEWRLRARKSADDKPEVRLAPARYSWLFLLPMAVACLWQAAPMVQVGKVGAVVYGMSEFPTNTGLPEWLATHSMRDDMLDLPANTSAWAAYRHISAQLRIGQHMLHALFLVCSGQSAVATWSLMVMAAAAIQGVAALLLGYQATRGSLPAAAAIGVMAALHPLTHSAGATTFISMALGLAFLTAACALAFAMAEVPSPRRLAWPLGVCATAMVCAYPEVLPTFVMVSALYWTFSMGVEWGRGGARAVRLLGGALCAALAAVAVSPAGVWWNLCGLLRQIALFPHGRPPEMSAEMLSSLVTGLAQLPGTGSHLANGGGAVAARWGAAALLAAGLMLQLWRRGPQARAVVAAVGSCLLLVSLLLARNKVEADALDYGLSRAIVYHGFLLFTFGLGGWCFSGRKGWLSLLAVGGFAGLVVQSFPRYFSNLTEDPQRTIEAVPEPPAWLDRIPPGEMLLFETRNKADVAVEAPYWRWLNRRTAFDTFLEVMPLSRGSDEEARKVLETRVGGYLVRLGRPAPAGMKDRGADGQWRIFEPVVPFVVQVGRFTPAGRKPAATTLSRYWLCLPDPAKVPFFRLQLVSHEEQDAECKHAAGKQTIHLASDMPVEIVVRTNPGAHIVPFSITCNAPVTVRIADHGGSTGTTWDPEIPD